MAMAVGTAKEKEKEKEKGVAEGGRREWLKKPRE